MAIVDAKHTQTIEELVSKLGEGGSGGGGIEVINLTGTFNWSSGPSDVSIADGHDFVSVLDNIANGNVFIFKFTAVSTTTMDKTYETTKTFYSGPIAVSKTVPIAENFSSLKDFISGMFMHVNPANDPPSISRFVITWSLSSDKTNEFAYTTLQA